MENGQETGGDKFIMIPRSSDRPIALTSVTSFLSKSSQSGPLKSYRYANKNTRKRATIPPLAGLDNSLATDRWISCDSAGKLEGLHTCYILYKFLPTSAFSITHIF